MCGSGVRDMRVVCLVLAGVEGRVVSGERRGRLTRELLRSGCRGRWWWPMISI